MPMTNLAAPSIPDLQQYAQGAVAAPFGLVLDDGSILQSLEVVRRVPGKRLVCRGLLNGQAIYAKLFIGGQAGKYAARDKRGSRWLAQARLATPTLLLESGVASQGCEALLYGAIPARNAEQVWQDLDEEGRHALALRLVEEVARHHRAGLLQTDLYLKNFLVDAQAVYTLDGDGIRQLRVFGRQRQQWDNLARLISKFDVDAVAAWLPSLLRQYVAVIGGTASDIDIMQQLIARHWQRDMRQYASKVQRSCTDVAVEEKPWHYLAINRAQDSPGVRQALATPDGLLDATSAVRLKSGNTCTVAAVEIDQRKMVIKRYNIKNFWHGLGRAWRPSRAVVSWSNAFRLQLKGIATPAAVAVLERRWLGLRREAYLLTEFMIARDAAEFYADLTIDREVKERVAQRIARLFFQLFCLQLEHGDFKATNILIRDQHPLLIDLDSMRQHACKKRFERRHARDLQRFFKNWQGDAATSQLLAAAFRAVYADGRVLDQAGIVFNQSEKDE